jgi:hypothetical protein
VRKIDFVHESKIIKPVGYNIYDKSSDKMYSCRPMRFLQECPKCSKWYSKEGHD